MAGDSLNVLSSASRRLCSPVCDRYEAGGGYRHDNYLPYFNVILQIMINFMPKLQLLQFGLSGTGRQVLA